MDVWKVIEATTLAVLVAMILCLVFLCLGCAPVVVEHKHEHKHSHERAPVIVINPKEKGPHQRR